MKMTSKRADSCARMSACALVFAIAFGGAGLVGCGSSAPSSAGDAGSQAAQSQSAGQVSASVAEHDTWVATKSTLKSENTPPADAQWQGNSTQTVTTNEFDEHGNCIKSHSETTYQDDSASQAQAVDEETTYDDKGYRLASTSTIKVDYAGQQTEDKQAYTYKNEYDDQGRLTKQAIDNESTIASNISNQVYAYEYNEAGYVSRVTYSYTDTSEGAQPYVHDVVSVSEFDEKGVLQKVSTTTTNKEDGTQIGNDVFNYKYEYDDQGRPTSGTATSDQDSSYSFEWHCTYDQNGNIATEKMTTKSDKIGVMTTEDTAEWKKIDNPSTGTKQNHHISRYR